MLADTYAALRRVEQQRAEAEFANEASAASAHSAQRRVASGGAAGSIFVARQ